MNGSIFGFVVPAAGLIAGLIAAYVSLQNRALLAEVRKELVELEYRISEKMNGKYVRTQECHLRETNLQARLDLLMDEIQNNKAAGG